MSRARPILRSLWGWMALVMGLAWLLAMPQSVQAQRPTPSDDEVNAIAREMYCPVCENVPLDVCPTQACAQWRELIRQKLAEGWSEQQIKDYFVAQYGDRVLGEPPRRGLHWLIYILPPLSFLIGALIVFNVFRAMRRPTAPTAATAEPQEPGALPDDPYLARLEEELRRRERGE